MSELKDSLKTRFSLKEGIEISDLQKINPNLVIVFGWFVKFCNDNHLECCITNLISEKTPNSVSSTHPEGRAIDCRSKFWPEEKIKECINFMNKNCGHLGAVTQEGTKRVIVYHDAGYGYHFHLQVQREF